jgi:hypothetical protein
MTEAEGRVQRWQRHAEEEPAGEPRWSGERRTSGIAVWTRRLTTGLRLPLAEQHALGARSVGVHFRPITPDSAAYLGYPLKSGIASSWSGDKPA